MSTGQIYKNHAFIGTAKNLGQKLPSSPATDRTYPSSAIAQR
jgi:hypothetical protein